MIDFKSKIYVAGHNGLVGSAIVRKLKDEENNHIDPTNYHYNPRLASIKEYNSVSNKIIENTPITLISIPRRVLIATP